MQSIPQSKFQSWRFDWIFSPGRDLLYFFLPVPFALMLFEGARVSEISNALLFALIGLEVTGLGAFHQGATWFHFLDRRNREHYLVGTKGLLVFVLTPLLLFLTFVVADYFFAPLAFIIYVCWSLNHVVQQNIGILLLYQNSKANEVKIPRNIQAWSQRWLSICFALIFFQRTVFASTPLNDFLFLPIALSGLMGVGYCVAYIIKMIGQMAQEKYVNLPGFFFWILCVLYLLPFAFLGKNYVDALLIPLVVHWCQYIGINYIVAERKYEGAENVNLPFKPPVLVYLLSGATLVSIMVALTYWRQTQGVDSSMGRLLQGVILGFGMVHYYLDGFLWRFRDKFPREAMLPYLTRR